MFVLCMFLVDSERDRESEVEPELTEERRERSRGNSCSCAEDWSDSTELVLGYLLHKIY